MRHRNSSVTLLPHQRRASWRRDAEIEKSTAARAAVLDERAILVQSPRAV
jgi:hypothetical protein